MVDAHDGSLVEHAFILVPKLRVVRCIARRHGSSGHDLGWMGLQITTCLNGEALHPAAHIARLRSDDRAACVRWRKVIHLEGGDLG